MLVLRILLGGQPGFIGDFPLKNGVYYVANGGSTIVVNVHNPAPAQRYALDIGKLNPQHDLTPPQRDAVNLAGNYVFIHCQAQDVEVLLAHMMKGSIVVAVGELVQENQRLGLDGNSGNTSQPHLHIHATRNGPGGSHLDGEAVPILFDGRFLVRNDLVNALEKSASIRGA
jgi:murein DD-endopeptidase MepM/ murein hydrolase activator NlpD